MGVKKVNGPFVLNWSAVLNSPYSPNVPLSGVTAGAMAATNTIYSNTQFVENVDNIGLQVSWTGTPTGMISVLGSNDGNVYFALTFNPALAQPAGSPGSYGISINQFPWRLMCVQYTNTSGSGVLTVVLETKDLN